MDKLRNILLFLFIVLIIFLAGEAAARKIYGDGFFSLVDPQLHHRMRPYIDIERSWATGKDFRFITNSLGWRDSIPRHRVKRITDKEKRMLFLGDSFTEAVGYNQEHTFSGRVETLLKREGRECEVLNGGTSSYSPLLEYMRLKRFIDRGYKADIVILFLDFSDVQDETLYSAKYINDEDGEPLRLRGAVYKYPILSLFLNSSCLFRSFARFAKSRYDKLTKLSSRTDEDVLTSDRLVNLNLGNQSELRSNWEGHLPSISGWVKNGLESLEVNMVKIKKLCNAQGMPLIVVIYPWPQQLYVEEDHDYYEVLREYFGVLYEAREKFYGKSPSKRPSLYEEAVEFICERHSIDLVNLYPEIIDEPNNHILYIRNDIHFNRNGHSFIAEKIKEAIMDKI